MSVVKFSEVAHRANTKEDRFNTDKIYYVGGEHIEPGELFIHDKGFIKGSTIGPMFYCGFKSGQILFVTRNPHLRKCSVAEFDGICSEKTFVIETIDKRILLQEYLASVMLSDDFWNYCEENKSGGVNYFLNWSTLADYEFELPSVEEQKAISDKVWAAYRLKESYKKLLAATEEMVKSQFIEMFGDTHVKSDNSRQWKEVVEIINGKDYKTIQVEDGGYPVYGTGGEMARAADYLSPANSILLGRKGTIDKPLLIKEKYWNVDTAFGAVPDENILNYVYFYWHCKTIDFNILNKGTTLPSTTKVDLLNLWVKIPAMEEQNRFASIVEQADKSGFVGFKSQFIEMFGIAEATKPLADFVEVSFPGEWGQEDKDGSGVKVIRTTNFTNNGKLDLSEVVTRDIDSAKIEKKKLFKGDIILERSGGTNDNPVGRVVYFEEDGVYLFNNFTQLLRCKEGVNSLFIFYSLFNYYQMNKNVIRSMGNKTTGIQNLKMDRYWQIPIADISTERQKVFESIYRQADKSKLLHWKSIKYSKYSL